jgi:regulator of sigma E protease
MMGSLPLNLAVAMVVLGIIIVLHELGHFLVAKFFKIRVETFSVGFGPRLIGFRKGDTDYRLSAFPLGGYVKMAGETPSEMLEAQMEPMGGVGVSGELFLAKPKWQRFLVAVAGPAMNILLAIGLIAGLYMYGTDVPEFVVGQAVVNVVEPGSPADRTGIKPGDQIVSFDGKDRPDWQNIQNTVVTSPGRAIPIVVERDGKRMEFTITPERKGREEAGDVGMVPYYRQLVQDFQANSPALTAGMQRGDEIIRVNGIDVRANGRTLQQIIQQIPEESFPVTVLRGGKEIEFNVRPITQDGRRMIGIIMQWTTVHIKLGPLAAVQKSIETNKENAVLIFQVIGRLLKREASVKQLDGPISIISMSGQMYQAGFVTLLTFMALISLNLGILNIMPIPILDGGVILLLVIESLLGRDLSLRMKERIVQASVVFILMIMVIVLYNDVLKLLPPSQPAP